MTSRMNCGNSHDLNCIKTDQGRGGQFIFIVNIEATAVTAFPFTIIMTLREHLLLMRTK